MCALPACCSSFCRQAFGLFCWIIVVCFYDSIHFYPCRYLTLALLVRGPHVVWECVCVYVWMCVCVCICMCVFVCVCVWTEWSWSMHCVGISTIQFILYYASVDTRTYACTCAHMHAHTCMHTLTQILQPHCQLTACLTLMLPPVKCACRVMVWSLSATSSVSVSTWSQSSVKCLPPGPSFLTADWMVERERGGIWLDGEELASDWMVRERWHLIGRWKMLSDWIVERELASDWMVERGGTSDRVMDTKGTSAQMMERERWHLIGWERLYLIRWQIEVYDWMTDGYLGQ